jgi:drug/metabolite transporter (DMT)-like permease
MTGGEWALLVILAAIWGGSFFFVKLATAELPTLSIVLGRVGLAALALWAVVHAMGQRMPADAATWGGFFVMGLINNALPFTLIFWGQREIGVGLAAILNATTPVFAVLLAHVASSDERLTPARIAGVLLGLAGVAVLIGPGALAGLGDNVLAQLAMLGAALCYALGGRWGRRFRALPPMTVAAGQVTASTLLMLPLVLVVDRPWMLPMPGATTWAAILGLSLLCTAFAYTLYFRILATAGATNLMLVTLLVPVSAILLGALALGERLDAKHLAGMALIALGLAAIDGRAVAALGRRRTP